MFLRFRFSMLLLRYIGRWKYEGDLVLDRAVFFRIGCYFLLVLLRLLFLLVRIHLGLLADPGCETLAAESLRGQLLDGLDP